MRSVLVETLVGMRRFRGRSRLISLLLRLGPQRPTRSKYGPLLVSVPSDRTNLLAIGGETRDYDDVAAEVVKLRDGMCFIDVGANQGLFSLLAASRVGNDGVVFSFEPSLRVFGLLCRNVEANNLGGRIFMVNSSLGTGARQVEFSEGLSQHSGIGRVQPGGTKLVWQLCLDRTLDLVDALAGTRNVVVKIDVEGGEVDVLRSMEKFLSRENVEKLIVEVDSQLLLSSGESSDSLYELADRMGFLPTKVSRDSHYNEIFVKKTRMSGPHG